MISDRVALVVGGAGRFGSELSGLLSTYGWKVVVLDSLVTSDSRSITEGPLVKVDVREHARVTRALNEYKVLHIFYCAMTEPQDISERWDQHLTGLMSVLKAAKGTTVTDITVLMPQDTTAALTERLMKDCATVINVRVRMIPWSDEALKEALPN